MELRTSKKLRQSGLLESSINPKHAVRLSCPIVILPTNLSQLVTSKRRHSITT